MGWQDRQYRTPGDGGGFRRAFGRAFGEGGGGFFGWALPLFTLWGIRVRLHIVFIIYIAVRLIWSMEPGRMGLVYTAISLAMLFTIVLIHEFGHCIACRKVGGEANDILLWPLGGLATVNPPHHPRAALITTIGGPFMHLLIGPVLGVALVALGVPASVLILKPFDPFGPATLAQLTAPGSEALLYARFLVFSAYVMNAYLFFFNVFLPMYPMDGGRILQEILWFRMGYRRSMQIATQVGIIAAIIVGIFAFSRGLSVLLMIAILCGLESWQQRSRLAFLEPEMYSGDYGYRAPRVRTRGRDFGGTATATRPSRADVKRKQREEDLQAEVDRILAKIATQGMASLTKKEKAILQGETERKRRQAAGE